MKRIIVMRHAKSDWNTDAPTDHARPLNRRGRKDAPRVARRLVELGWQPQHILASDANRTRQTYELMAPELGGDVGVEYLRSLYHAGPDRLHEHILGLSDEFATILVLGHNPGWEQVLTWLTGEAASLTTANAALIECENAETWNAVVEHAGDWTICDILRPREL